MSFGTVLYTLLIRPIQLIFEVIYSIAYQYIGNVGLAIIALSLAINFLVLPLYQRADAMQEEERETEAKLKKWVDHIKKTFHGDERTMMLQTYYRQNSYSPTYVLRSAVSLFLEIPFFIAAYRFLSGLELLNGVSFGPIADLGQPDALIVLGGITINLLPFVMTAVNIVSSAIFTKNYPLKTKIQLYAMAAFFLVFLYKSPSGLVFYWTLNNLFSLVKTIFYKLNNSRFVLSVMAAVFSIAVFIFSGKLYVTGHHRSAPFYALIGVCLWIPLLLGMLRKRGKIQPRKVSREPNKRIFFLGGVLLAVLIGFLIPSAVIKASPQEFMDALYFVHPLWYLAYSLLISVGLFVFWFGVFYWLADSKIKPLFECVVWGLCGVAIVDYLLFGTDLGLINSNLTFENGLNYSFQKIVLNGVVVIAVFAILAVVFVKFKKVVPKVMSIAAIAFVCMAVVNCSGIYKSIASVDISEVQDSTPHVTLSTTGQNVVVIMLDRAMGEYIPYLFNERPELVEQFDGFTYYDNVVSFGAFTNFATPALYGGYEYTPIEMNRRSDESLASKQNEALSVMPVLFDSNGYDVTVFDPTYAGYQWTPDLSIYDEYSNINSYVSMGYFSNTENIVTQISDRNRNFFFYGLMKSVPLIAQTTIYDNGEYHQNRTGGQSQVQVVNDMHTSSGTFSNFMNSYNVLRNMTNITEFSNTETGSFFMMSNDTTHDVMMLSEPDYIPSEVVDNTQYDAVNASRFDVNGRVLNVENSNQMIHYQSNMAAMIQLGQWFDYLRESGVYDNTRIILVSDHGRALAQIEELLSDDASDTLSDYEYYFPLLMVKDFNGTGFTTSSEFMTNADVPTLATEGVIENPINPMTGNVLDSSEKNEHDQYVIASTEYDVNINNGNTYLPARWYTIHDSIWDRSNWTLVAENAVLPLESDISN